MSAEDCGSSLIEKILPVWIAYVSSEGYPGVRARTWHPLWFIPNWRHRLSYRLRTFAIRKEYLRALQEINREVNRGCSPDALKRILQGIDCGCGCEFRETYGFVPEAGCPVHD